VLPNQPTFQPAIADSTTPASIAFGQPTSPVQHDALKLAWGPRWLRNNVRPIARHRVPPLGDLHRKWDQRRILLLGGLLALSLFSFSPTIGHLHDTPTPAWCQVALMMLVVQWAGGLWLLTLVHAESLKLASWLAALTAVLNVVAVLLVFAERSGHVWLNFSQVSDTAAAWCVGNALAWAATAWLLRKQARAWSSALVTGRSRPAYS
jgi:hypothetical protein